MKQDETWRELNYCERVGRGELKAKELMVTGTWESKNVDFLHTNKNFE